MAAGRGKKKLARAKFPKNPTAKVLRKALALIEKRGAWLQGADAATRDGNELEYDAEDAVRFCSAGAIWRAAAGDQESRLRARVVLGGVVAPAVVIDWNDAPGRKKSEVIAVFKKAIEIAERES